MPQPTLSDVHVNVPLTNMSLAFFQEDDAFVADRVFPGLPSENVSNVYYTYPRGYFNRNSMRKRAPGTESAGGGYTVDNTKNYLIDVWSLHDDVPDQIRANSDAVLNPDADATSYLNLQAKINREVQWATTFFGAGVWTNSWTANTHGSESSTVVCYWNDYTNSTPIQDVRNLKRQVQLTGGGFRPNKAVMNRKVFDILCDHPTIIDRLKYGQTWMAPGTTPAMANRIIMAQLFELDEVLVMDSIQNTAAEPAPGGPGVGTDNENNSFIAGNSFMLAYTPSAPGLKVPAAGYTFNWTGLFGAVATGIRIKSFYLERNESTRVEIDSAYTHKMVSADLGGFINSVVQ